MGCGLCEQAFSGLVGGFVSLVSFIVVPASQIFLASIKMIFEKVKIR